MKDLQMDLTAVNKPFFNLFNFRKQNEEIPKSFQAKLKFLNSQKLGSNSLVSVPDFKIVGNETFRPLLHLDYTASAQGLKFIENYILELMEFYANTHTETSETGRVSTTIFHTAIEIIRKHVGAGKDSFVIPVGYGATGAIERIQKILGINMSPKCQKVVADITGHDLKEALSKKYVVFVGPYEHHSNDVSWQDDALCKFVRIKAKKDSDSLTEIDLEDLEKNLIEHKDFIKIGSFSAASNVTGIKTDITSLSKLLKKHDSLFFLDYAAAAPYVDINMEKDNVDAIFISAHKNIGGANLGLLIGKNHIYDTNVAPSFGGGGTVQAVTPWSYHFHDNIEEREYSGTPAIRQTWQAALSFELKDWLGEENIHAKEQELVKRFMDFFSAHPKLRVLGNENPEKRIGIFSFLVSHGSRVLHHNLVASLLNDLFGIQARSGCACAGPFGHELLAIEKDISDKYVDLILAVKNGFKPGWTRIGSHYSLSDEEVNYTFMALNAIAYFGPLFIDNYNFNPKSGEWKFVGFTKPAIGFGISDLFNSVKHGKFEKSSESKNSQFLEAVKEFSEVAAAKFCKIAESYSASLNKTALSQSILKAVKSLNINAEDLASLIKEGQTSSNQKVIEDIFLTYTECKGSENVPFSSLDQVEEAVRFFYAPESFEKVLEGSEFKELKTNGSGRCKSN